MKRHSAMKKLATLLLAAALTVGAVQQRAAAADIRVSGIWDFNFEWNEISFDKQSSDDTFHARQRLRTQVDFIASEALRGVVFFEIGTTNWGQADEGGSLGTDATNIKVRYSYVDWVVPNTDLNVRMGLQPYALPSFVAGSPILDDADGAGVTLNYTFNDMVGLTLFWLRAEHDNAYDDNDDIVDRGLGGNLDFFGASLPLTGDGWALTPWGVYGNVGRNSLVDPDEGGDYGDVVSGMMPYGVPGAAGTFLKDTNNPAWWLGFGGELTLFDPFRVALDVAYGKVDWGSIDRGRDVDLTREGWLAIASLDYRLDSVTPGLIFWYGSGDDDDPFNGSERMPTIRPSWTATTFGFDDGWGVADCDVIGLSPVGTWGVIARLADISFVEDLSHTLRVGYYTGSNDEDAVKNGAGIFGGAFTNDPVYLTRKDHALEVNFDSEYKIYENLTLAVELGYIHLDLDNDVWRNAINTDNLNKNLWKAGLNLSYAF